MNLKRIEKPENTLEDKNIAYSNSQTPLPVIIGDKKQTIG